MPTLITVLLSLCDIPVRTLGLLKRAAVVMTVVVCLVGPLDPKTLSLMNILLVFSRTTTVVLVGAVTLLVANTIMGRSFACVILVIRLHGVRRLPVVRHNLLLGRPVSCSTLLWTACTRAAVPDILFAFVLFPSWTTVVFLAT